VAEVGTSKLPGGLGGVQGPHNKPIGCGAFGAYAPGPDEEEEARNVKTSSQFNRLHVYFRDAGK
jgi:hypothetical protein